MTAMARVTSPRLMRGAIIGSVLVHLVVFALAAQLGFARGREVDPGELKVFNVEMARSESPERVEITPELPPPEPKVVAPRPSQPPVTRPEVETLREPPPKPRSKPGKATTQPRPTTPTTAAAPRPGSASPGRVGDANPNPGGGGGEVSALGSGRGDFSMPGGGVTAPGSLPGTGTGSGSGSGSGSGTGTGSGTGSGSGSGQGGGAAPPPPPPPRPSPKVEPKPDPPPPHVSRLADRKAPARKHVVAPAYPAWAREQGIEGTVTLELTVTEKGEVSSPGVVSSSGNKRLDDEALKAVRKWTYEPAVQDGKPRAVRIREKIRFRLG